MKQLIVSLLFLYACKAVAVVHAVETKEKPTLNQLNADPCNMYDRSVKEFSADIWLVHSDYSNCSNDTEGIKVRGCYCRRWKQTNN